MHVVIRLSKFFCPARLVPPKKLEVNTHKAVISLVVLYCCESWSLALREEQRLRELENKMLRKIFERPRGASG